MYQQEVWQEYDLAGTPLQNGGRTRVDAATTPGSLTGVANIWLYRKTPAGIELLFQQRSSLVSHYAGKFDVSAGGHINYGETALSAAIREAEEEIGIKVTPSQLKFLMTFVSDSSFRHIFAADWTEQPHEFNFNDAEVSKVEWVPLAKIDAFCQQYVKLPLARDVTQFSFLTRWLKNHA